MSDQPACLAEQGKPWECGSHSTYNNHGCRGDACRAANVEFNRNQRNQRRERLEAGLVDPEHGKESTYFNYMCRCDECRAAHTAAESDRRRVRRGTSDETPVTVG